MIREKKDIFSIKDFAEELDVHVNTVRNMIKHGLLSAFKIGCGGKTSHYRIPRSEIDRMALLNLRKVIDNIKEEE